MPSTKSEPREATKFSSTKRFAAIIPPKAESASDSSACGKASVTETPLAIPIGVKCLTITTVGSSKLLTARQAASRSRMLL